MSVNMKQKDIDIDNVIQNLLYDYAKWCRYILDKDAEKIKRGQIRDSWEIDMHNSAESAYSVLLEIAKNPKDYLYSGKNLVYAPNNLHAQIEPLFGNKFDRSSDHFFYRVCEKIADHVNNPFKNGEKWHFYDNKSVMDDVGAADILKYARMVKYWNAKNNVFKQLHAQFMSSRKLSEKNNAY